MQVLQIDTPFGILELMLNRKNLVAAAFLDQSQLLGSICMTFQEFMCNEWLLAPQGSEFQQRVWQECRKIPWGQTLSYGELAERIGAPHASQAVGSALGHNPIALLIPCHRVIQKNGSLGGYRWGTNRKQDILDWERHYPHLQWKPT